MHYIEVKVVVTFGKYRTIRFKAYFFISEACEFSAASRIWRTCDAKNDKKSLFQFPYIFHSDIALQVGLAEHLQPVVGEDVEVGGREEIEGVLRGHDHIAVVDVAKQGVKTLPTGHHLPNTDQNFVVHGAE